MYTMFLGKMDDSGKLHDLNQISDSVTDFAEAELIMRNYENRIIGGGLDIILKNDQLTLVYDPNFSIECDTHHGVWAVC
jgi:hypothetical protein